MLGQKMLLLASVERQPTSAANSVPISSSEYTVVECNWVIRSF